MNSTAIAGSVLVDASSIRRITKPQPPPVRCCSISNAIEPIAMPVQNVHPIRYAAKNRSWFQGTSIARISTTPTISARLMNCVRFGGLNDALINRVLQQTAKAKQRAKRRDRELLPEPD